jgi:two-component system, NtrC family, response regulator AtoC
MPVDQITNQLLCGSPVPIADIYPRQITLLLNDEGDVLDISKSDFPSPLVQPLIQTLERGKSIRELFGISRSRPLAEYLGKKKSVAFFSTGDYFHFVESLEAFYSSLPIYFMEVIPVAKGRFIGVIVPADLVPNIFEKNSGSLIYLDPMDRLVGFNQSFYEFFSNENGSPKNLLGKPAGELISPAPLEFQKDALRKAGRPQKKGFREFYGKKFPGNGLGPEDETTKPQDFSKTGHGLLWKSSSIEGSYLTLLKPIDIEKADWWVEVEFQADQGDAPFVVFGDRATEIVYPDRNGYQIGIDSQAHRILLKKNGFPIMSAPVGDHKPSFSGFTVVKNGPAFHILQAGRELFSYFDWDYLERAPGYLSLFLRSGSGCVLKKLSAYEKPAGPPPRLAPFVVSLKNGKQNQCLLNQCQSFALAAKYKDIRGFRLQDVTVMQNRLKNLETDYHKQIRKSERLTRELDQFKKDGEFFIGSGKWSETLKAQVERIAVTPATVLIQGPTGTGKEVVAHRIYEKSASSHGPFVKVDCSTLAPTLMESELFGHEKGAFTGADQQRIGLLERANEGTLFLDEVGNLTPSVQANLLQFLQDFKITRVGGAKTIELKVRILCASNRDLREMISLGLFREDLYYRIAVIKIDLPPLRDLREDLAGLSGFFLRRFRLAYGKNIKGISTAAFDKLARHSWPGNVREFKNVMEKAVIFCDGEEIGPEHIVLEGPQAAKPSIDADPRRRIPFSKEEITAALKMHGGRVTVLAEEWGVTPRALYYNLRALEIDPNDFRARPRKSRV